MILPVIAIFATQMMAKQQLGALKLEGRLTIFHGRKGRVSFRYSIN